MNRSLIQLKEITEIWTKPGGILNYVSGQYSISRIDDPRITLVAGGYPLFVNGKIAGGIGVSGGSEEEHRTIAEHVIAVFDQLNKESLG